MFRALSPGAMGVKVGDLAEAIKVARAAGFEGVEVGIHEVADLVEAQGAGAVQAMFAEQEVKPAGWGLPVAWNGDQAKWAEGLQALPRLAAAGQAIGCTRVSTWVMPGSNDRTAEEQRRFHVERFGPIAKVLADHGCRLGLEFIGPATIRKSLQHVGVYTAPGMLELAAEIGPNVGLLLDCWHWYTSGGTLADLYRMQNEDIVYVHVNDAPPDVAFEDHVDNKRCLPGATGVINLTGFLQALEQIGYDGPVVPEPFGSPATWAGDALRAAWHRAGL